MLKRHQDETVLKLRMTLDDYRIISYLIYTTLAVLKQDEILHVRVVMYCLVVNAFVHYLVENGKQR